MSDYLLNIPDKLHERLKDISINKEKSLRETIIYLLKSGVFVMDIQEDTNKELLYREKSSNSEKFIHFLY